MYIQGPAGTGKTMTAEVMAEILVSLNFFAPTGRRGGITEAFEDALGGKAAPLPVSTGQVIEIRKKDLASEYLGGTEHKAKEQLERWVNNVAFWDEAYELGKEGGYGDQVATTVRVAYSLYSSLYTPMYTHCTCIYTIYTPNKSYRPLATLTFRLNHQLVKFLSDHERDFVMIIAGYKKELEESFFKVNPGLESRFPRDLRFDFHPYAPVRRREEGDMWERDVGERRGRETWERLHVRHDVCRV